MVPPAFSTLSIAVREAPATSILIDLGLQSPSARMAHAILDAADHAGCLQRAGGIDTAALAVELACVNGCLDYVQRYVNVEVAREMFLKAALGQNEGLRLASWPPSKPLMATPPRDILTL